MPPGSIAASAASPSTRWIDARRFVPASVRINVPSSNSNAARANAPRRFLVLGEPAQPPGDHEVQHDEQSALELEHDALAQAAHAHDLPSFRRRTEAGRRCAARRDASSGYARAPSLQAAPAGARCRQLRRGARASGRPNELEDTAKKGDARERPNQETNLGIVPYFDISAASRQDRRRDNAQFVEFTQVRFLRVT